MPYKEVCAYGQIECYLYSGCVMNNRFKSWSWVSQDEWNVNSRFTAEILMLRIDSLFLKTLIR